MKTFNIVRFFVARDARKFLPGDAVIRGEKEFLTSFATKEEALEALSWYQNRYELCHCAIGEFFVAEEFAVEENEFDDAVLVASTILATADASDWNAALNHDWLRKNKFALKIANFDGIHFGEWMTIEESDGGWYDDVADYLRTLRQNGFFDEDADAATRDQYRYKVVATYGCRDVNEDWPMTWSELAELAGKEETE